MGISGMEQSSVILGQNKDMWKIKCNAQIMAKQVEAKCNGVINPQNYNLNQF